MRGVDLNVFDFDYDLTWAGFFMNADERIYGRFGGREDGNAEAHLTLAALKYAMRQALDAHREKRVQPKPAAKPVRSAEQFAAAARVKEECIHCHMVYDFSRDAIRSDGKWQMDMTWVYPPPKSVGLELDRNQGNRVANVLADSPAQRAGIRPGDVLESVNDRRVASYGDVQWALEYSTKAGEVPVTWQRGDATKKGTLTLRDGWRKSDISWRESMWGLEPSASVYGRDLSPEEKKKLGLSEKRLAFSQGDFVPPPARNAGIQKKDIIIGIDGKELEMNMLQFNVHIRLNFKAGDKITFDVIRDGKRLEVPMVLPKRDN